MTNSDLNLATHYAKVAACYFLSVGFSLVLAIILAYNDLTVGVLGFLAISIVLYLCGRAKLTKGWDFLQSSQPRNSV